MIHNLRHIGIVVADIDKQLHFYKDLLGCEIVSETDEPSHFINKILGIQHSKLTTIKMSFGSDCILELLYFKSHKCVETDVKELTHVGLTHFSLTVKDLNNVYNTLVDHGIKFICSPEESPNGKAMVAFCQDQEGNFIEMVQELKTDC